MIVTLNMKLHFADVFLAVIDVARSFVVYKVLKNSVHTHYLQFEFRRCHGPINRIITDSIYSTGDF